MAEQGNMELLNEMNVDQLREEVTRLHQLNVAQNNQLDVLRQQIANNNGNGGNNVVQALIDGLRSLNINNQRKQNNSNTNNNENKNQLKSNKHEQNRTSVNCHQVDGIIQWPNVSLHKCNNCAGPSPSSRLMENRVAIQLPDTRIPPPSLGSERFGLSHKDLDKENDINGNKKLSRIPLCPRIILTIFSVPIPALIDTGSQISAISENFYQYLSLHGKLTELPVSNLSLFTAIVPKDIIRFDKIPYESLTLSEFQDGIKYIQTIGIESNIQLNNNFKKQGNNCLINDSVEIDFEGCLENLFCLNDSDLYENREMFIFRKEPEEQKDSNNFIEGLRSIIDSVSHLSEEEKKVFIERMSRFEKLFTPKYESADTFEYELKIKPHKTYIRKSYPIPWKHREPVGKQMQKMLDLKIIERADCSYCSPLRIVIKDDGTVRICLDARFINEIIEDDHESPPLINELLQKYYGVTFISTTDLATGYWQIPLHPNSRKYTAFVYDSKEKNPWEWTSQHDEAFKIMKLAFVNSVKLSHHIPNSMYKLQTDASDIGISGVLYQFDHENNPRIVSLVSRCLNSAEVNYTTTEKELLAIVYSITKLRTYLLGEKFEVITDHKGLTFLHTTCYQSSRLIRWSIILQQYNYNVSYCQGKDNIIADFFSRNPRGKFEDVMQNYLSIDVVNVCHDFDAEFCVNQISYDVDLENSLKNLADLQHQDEFAMSIFDRIKIGKAEECYLSYNRVLFRMDKFLKLCQVFIPAVLTKRLIDCVHSKLGHPGVYKTLMYLKQFYFWKGMGKQVKNQVLSCDLCQRVKCLNKKMEGEYRLVQSTEPGDLVSVDFFGPLPRSIGGLQYIFVVLDVFSKYVKLYPIKKETTEIVLKKLRESYFPEMGKPKRILADHGSQFTSKKWSNCLSKLEVKVIFSSIRHPQGNPVERVMRELGRFFRTLCSERHTRWEWRIYTNGRKFIFEESSLTFIDGEPEQQFDLLISVHQNISCGEEF
ncbi:uncharacterized protein LOC122504619 [Leptopilina heterotoma]|uniref:uncharacterized protein LOC122504619 n=1 Tax=Leptopilina heterotoma TaxID=63436 RepID=UPI001CA9F0D2|nr:uncharacterized protein LOC122504619 [Leptopilina heterotoma]